MCCIVRPTETTHESPLKHFVRDRVREFFGRDTVVNPDLPRRDERVPLSVSSEEECRINRSPHGWSVHDPDNKSVESVNRETVDPRDPLETRSRRRTRESTASRRHHSQKRNGQPEQYSAGGPLTAIRTGERQWD